MFNIADLNFAQFLKSKTSRLGRFTYHFWLRSSAKIIKNGLGLINCSRLSPEQKIGVMPPKNKGLAELSLKKMDTHIFKTTFAIYFLIFSGYSNVFLSVD